MLGELIADITGQLTSTRVLSAEGPAPKMEATGQGGGTLLDVAVTVVGTYWQTTRTGGVLYGEGQVVFTSHDGNIATWKGFGVGTATGAGLAASYAVCGTFQTEAPRLARLNRVATVSEYDVDEAGKWTWRISEWKAKAAGS